MTEDRIREFAGQSLHAPTPWTFQTHLIPVQPWKEFFTGTWSAAPAARHRMDAPGGLPLDGCVVQFTHRTPRPEVFAHPAR